MAVATDNFNRADGAVGSNWTQPPASGGTLNVASNQCGASATSTFCCDFWNAATFVADHYSQVTVGTPSPSPGEALGVIVRAKAGTDEFYLGFITSNQFQIYKRQAGSFTQLTFGSFTASAGNVIKVEATGSSPVTVNLYQNGTLRVTYSATGGDIINGGSPGILIYDSGNVIRVDDWEGGATTGGTVTTGNFLGFM